MFVRTGARVRRWARRWPLGTATVFTAITVGLLVFGEWAARLAGAVRFFDSVARLPVLLFVLGIIALGRWWRRAGFRRRPRVEDLRHAWPLLLVVGWLLGLVAWLGAHDWTAIIAAEGVTAFWEEAAYRGVVFLALLPRGRGWAVFGSAALFSLAHGYGVFVQRDGTMEVFLGLFWPFALGVIFARVRLASRTIWITFAAHWAINVLDELSPAPLTWSGLMWAGVPAELWLLAVLFIASPGSSQRRRLVTVGATMALALMCGLGLLKGGPRPGWEGRGIDATLTLRDVERDADGWRLYRYVLTVRSKHAVITRVSLRAGIENEPVERIVARSGERRWSGRRVRSHEIVWEGGPVPKTEYAFRCRLARNGTARLRIDYIDRCGYEGAWKTELPGPGR